nr:thioesterase domain-containing protein [uncultured Rhodopila sp.]
MIGGTKRPVVFLFAGLTSDLAELSALRIGCQDALSTVPIGYPHWTEIRSQGLKLDDFVAHCQQQIEAHPSPGPKFLAGYSFGGHIAFAVAAELEASGATVGRLGLLDTAATPAIDCRPRSASRRLRDLANAFRAGDLDSQVGRIIAGLMRFSGYDWPLRLAARLRNVRLPRNMGKHIDLALQMHFNFQILLELLDRLSRPAPPRGFPAVLFRCVNHDPDEPDDLQWDRHLAHLRIIPISGDHLSLMDPPNIASLSKAFSSAMSDAPARPGESRGQVHMTS